MATYKVKEGQTVKHDGKVYNGGDSISDPPEDLLKSGSLELSDEKARDLGMQPEDEKLSAETVGERLGPQNTEEDIKKEEEEKDKKNPLPWEKKD